MPMRLRTPAEKALDAARTALAEAERAVLAEKAEQGSVRLVQKAPFAPRQRLVIKSADGVPMKVVAISRPTR